MTGTEGFIFGIVCFAIIAAGCWLVRQIYDDGNSKVKYRMRRLWYVLKFKAVVFDCISCNGAGEREISGGFMSGAPGPPILEECTYCLGSGKEKVGYAYRGIFKPLYRNRLASEKQEDQRKAEMVLGPARWRFDKGLDEILGRK